MEDKGSKTENKGSKPLAPEDDPDDPLFRVIRNRKEDEWDPTDFEQAL